MFEAIFEQGAGGQTGESVVERLVDELLLKSLPVGDVLGGADEPHAGAGAGAGIVGDDPATAVQPADGPVSARHPVVGIEGPSLCERQSDVAPGGNAIVLVQTVQVCLEAGLDLCRVAIEEPVHLGRPRDRVSVDVPDPAAQLGQGFEFGQPAGLFTKGVGQPH